MLDFFEWNRKMQDVPEDLRGYFSYLDDFLPDSYISPNQPAHPTQAPLGYCRAYSPEELSAHNEKFIKQQKIAFLQKILADYQPPTEVDPLKIAYIKAKVKEHNEQMQDFALCLALDCFKDFVPHPDKRDCLEAQKNDFLKTALTTFKPDMSKFQVPRNVKPEEVATAIEHHIDTERTAFINESVATHNKEALAELTKRPGIRLGLLCQPR